MDPIRSPAVVSVMPLVARLLSVLCPSIWHYFERRTSFGVCLSSEEH